MAFYDPSTKILHGRKMPQIYNKYLSVGQLIMDALFKTPDKISQICDDDGIELTCSQILDFMVNIAKNLFKLGFRESDVAGLLAASSTYMPATIFGCYLIRMPVNSIDKSFSVNQIVQIYRETKPKVVFCDDDTVDKLIEALEILESEAMIIILTERINGLLHITDLIQECDDVDESFIYEKLEKNERCSLIACTSGSTGYPKLARVSHWQQIQNFTWMNDFDPDILTFNMISPYWVSGINNLVFRVINGQKRLITSKQFTPDLFIDLVEKYKLEDIFLVPPHVSLLIESPRFQEADFSSIKCFGTGGLYVSENLRRIIQDKIPDCIVKIGYGMTEFGGFIAETGNDRKISSSVGVPTLNTQVKIQLDDGTTGGINEIGEILTKHPVTFLGYFNDRHKKIIDGEGWLHTGDMGFIDESHELNIMGQRMFAIRNFYNEIYPCEIEDQIDTIDGVLRCVVVGTPHPVYDEVTTALVVKETNSDLTEEMIFDATSDLPLYKQLHGGIFFVSEIPMTSSGKIYRKGAKELATKLKLERNLPAQNDVLENNQ